ncbi:MAG: PLDc N-terminal domain-containing protein [Candidatus Pacearchaeota archaeon]|nr:PLDc N-terminal domain-containing protein [Candidatus Pacearchaeota archaeon]
MMGFGEFLFWPFMAAFAGAWILIGILFLIFWIWMIVDCSKRNFKNTAEKIIWLLVIIFAHWVGSIVYFIVIRMYNPKGLMKK